MVKGLVFPLAQIVTMEDLAHHKVHSISWPLVLKVKKKARHDCLAFSIFEADQGIT